MTFTTTHADGYATFIGASKRIPWDIDRDVIRGREFDFSNRFLPDGLARTAQMEFLAAAEQVHLSQIQGRTYANMFSLVERLIGIKMVELSRDHWYGNHVALEALLRFTDEELKHRELFRRIERMAGAGMFFGYEFVPTVNGVSAQVLQASTWAVLALTVLIELDTQVHYRHSIETDENLSALYKDVFLFHWKEEAQHALLDELQWEREDARISDLQRDNSVNDLIGLVGAFDGILQQQALADASYFINTRFEREFRPAELVQVSAGLLGAYRLQFIGSGMKEERFLRKLASMVTREQLQRIQFALAPLMG